MLAIVLKDLRLLARDPAALGLLLVAPLLMITVITFARAGSAAPPRPLLPVVDDDQGPVARQFVELLERRAAVREMDRAAAEHLVRDLNRAPAAIVFPRGLSKRYLQGRPTDIALLTDPAQAVALDNVRALLAAMDRDAADLADPLYEPLFTFREESVTATHLSPKSVEQNVPGFTIMFVLLALVVGTSSALHDERGWGTLRRVLAAPAGGRRFLLGTLAARGLLGLLQGIVLLGWGRLVFGLDLGQSPAALLALLAALALAAAALGLLVGTLATAREQTLPLGLAATVCLSALCGLWWPLSIVPPWLQTAGRCFFPAWVMEGVRDIVLRDRGFDAIAAPLAVSLGQAVLALAVALGLFRRRFATR